MRQKNYSRCSVLAAHQPSSGCGAQALPQWAHRSVRSAITARRAIDQPRPVRDLRPFCRPTRLLIRWRSAVSSRNFFNVRILAPTMHVPKRTNMTLRLRARLFSTLTALAGFAALPVKAQNPASAAPVLTALGRPANAAVTVKFDTAYTGDTPVEARDASAGSFSVAQFGAEIVVPLPPSAALSSRSSASAIVTTPSTATPSRPCLTASNLSAVPSPFSANSTRTGRSSRA